MTVEEREKDVISIEEGKLEVKRTRYDKLVEDVVSEKVARDEGLDPEKSARVVIGKDVDGDPEIHVFGRSREAVDAIADGVRSPRVSIRRRYIGHNVNPKEEAELMRPALEELVKKTPDHVLGEPTELVKRALKSPSAAPSEEAAKKLNEVLDGFEPGKRTREESKRKEGS